MSWRVIVYTDDNPRLVKLPESLRWEPEPNPLHRAVSCRPSSRELAVFVAELCADAGLHGIIKKIPEPGSVSRDLDATQDYVSRRHFRPRGRETDPRTRNTGPGRTLSPRERVASRTSRYRP